jgi:chromosome segregation ATPase
LNIQVIKQNKELKRSREDVDAIVQEKQQAQTHITKFAYVKAWCLCIIRIEAENAKLRSSLKREQDKVAKMTEEIKSLNAARDTLSVQIQELRKQIDSSQAAADRVEIFELVRCSADNSILSNRIKGYRKRRRPSTRF